MKNKFNFKSIEKDIMKAAFDGATEQMREKIRARFPEIKDFTVTCNQQTKQFTITGFNRRAGSGSS
jgi:hypothetical protein